MTADDFIRLHGEKPFSHRDELISGIKSGNLFLHVSNSATDPSPCQELLHIYRQRLKHLRGYDSPHAHALRNDVEELCRNLEVHLQSRFRGWIFEAEDSPINFLVFEESQGNLILGSLRTVDKRKLDEATWEKLWGARYAG